MRIGPKVAKNRFFQVPHCNGGGYRDPSAVAEMRRTKAEGGWGVIMTEQTEIHPSSEITPFIEQHLWEDKDIPAMAAMAEAMKSHGALAGIQMVHVPYKGAGDSTAAVVSGQVHMLMTAPGAAIPFLESGRLRAIAVGSAARVKARSRSTAA